MCKYLNTELPQDDDNPWGTYKCMYVHIRIRNALKSEVTVQTGSPHRTRTFPKADYSTLDFCLFGFSGRTELGSHLKKNITAKAISG